METADLSLGSGVVRVRRSGPAGGRLVVCVHGLSVNLHVFDHLAERLADPERCVVTFDLRGRGRSEITPPGTYGAVAHARDVLEIADHFGADRFDCVGWSLGALIAITASGLAAHRVRTLTLVDQVCALNDPKAVAAVRTGLDRLDARVAEPDEYVAMVRAAGFVSPWSEYWSRMYAYELARVDGRYEPSTSRSACLEDLGHPDLDQVEAAWRELTMPVLLVRALTSFGGGLTVPDADLARFRRAVPRARVVEVDRNHFGVMTDDRTVTAISDLTRHHESSHS